MTSGRPIRAKFEDLKNYVKIRKDQENLKTSYNYNLVASLTPKIKKIVVTSKKLLKNRN